jgi:NAD(P)-dependent dehydrogenase (short-subunit alcohol dehydrogenase family)
MDFTDKKVLITGASRGIGFATAQEFLALGARVAVNGRSEQSVATAITELGGGDRLVAAAGSVSSAGACESIVQTALEGLGGLDVLVNNAGVCIDSTIEKSDEAIWDETLDVNLKGTFFCTRAALPALRNGGGAVVNTASISGLQGSTEGAVCTAPRRGASSISPAPWRSSWHPRFESTASAQVGWTPTCSGATTWTSPMIPPQPSARPSRKRR